MKYFLLFLLLLIPCIILTTTFSGYVYDQDTLDPIPGAVVTAGGLKIDNIYTDTTWVDTTDVNGYFFLDDLIPADDYTIRVSALGYESEDETMEEPPGTYDFFLWKPTAGILVETINEGLKNYQYNGEYWHRVNGEIYDNSHENFFYDIDAQSDTISSFMSEIGAGTDYTDQDDSIYVKLQTVWNWLDENCYYDLEDSLWIEASDYLDIQSGDHYYTIAALASTYYNFGFIPWGTCMSKANILATILYKTGIDPSRFLIGTCRWHLRYTQHMYIIIRLYNRWYHFDPTLHEDEFPSSETLASIPNKITNYKDYMHPRVIYQLPGSMLTDLPITTLKTRNDLLYIKFPPEKTHTLDTEITINGFADESEISTVIINGNSYPVINDQFSGPVNLIYGENNIEVEELDRQEYDTVVIYKDFYGETDFSTDVYGGIPPLEVNFTDTSVIPEYYTVNGWEWDFENDGTIDSYLQNPTWVYPDSGCYSISLKLTVENEEDIHTKNNFINVYENKLNGNVYLEGETNHSGIDIWLYRAADSLLVRHKFSNISGYYEFYTNTGVYFLKFEKFGYYPKRSGLIQFNENMTMPSFNLIVEKNPILVPQYLPNITTAISYANNGDTIRIAPGIYSENINFSGKDLHLESYFPGTLNPAFISNTVIQSQRSGSVITIENGEEYVSLDGFTVSGGNATNGGGINIHTGTFTNVDLRNLKITGNSAVNGGGLHCIAQELYAYNLEISDNYAETDGGGAYLKNIPKASLERLNVFMNEAADEGGGMFISGCDSLGLDKIDLSNNSSDFQAGGLYMHNSIVILKNSNISGNSAVNSAGMKLMLSNLKVYNTIIKQNTTDPAYNSGGGVYALISDVFFCNCNFIENYASNYGAALIGNNVSDIEIYNCIFLGNYGCSSIHLYDTNSELSAFNNDFCDEDDIFSNCNDSLGVITGVNVNGDSCDAFSNIFLDPVFMGPDNHNLFSTSPCINAGIQDTTGLYLPEIDYAANPRIIDEIVDIGAYEFQGEMILATPENINIEKINDQIRISWDIIYPATSYQVYSSVDVDGEYILEDGGSFNSEDSRVIWTKNLNPVDPKRYYRITAIRE